jgi:hypothetical protein
VIARGNRRNGLVGRDKVRRHEATIRARDHVRINGIILERGVESVDYSVIVNKDMVDPIIPGCCLR